MGLVLGDRLEEVPDRAVRRVNADAGGAIGVAPDRADLVVQVSQGAGSGLAGVLVLDRQGQLVAVGGLQDGPGGLGGEAGGGEGAKLVEVAVEALILQVDQLGELLGELLNGAGVAHDQAVAGGGGAPGPAAGKEAELVCADQAEVGEKDTEGGRAVERVEGVQVAADGVAGDDLTLDGDGGGGVDALAAAQDDDVVELGVLVEEGEQVDQRLVLNGLVVPADDAECAAVVGANEGLVGGDGAPVGVKDVACRCVAVVEGDRAAGHSVVGAGSGEGLGRGCVGSDRGAAGLDGELRGLAHEELTLPGIGGGHLAGDTAGHSAGFGSVAVDGLVCGDGLHGLSG